MRRNSIKVQLLTGDEFGGSYLTDKALLDYGKKAFGIQTSVSNILHSGFDLTILSNLQHIEDYAYENIKEPFVKIEHDYGFCNHYDALCNYHNCTVCSRRGEMWEELNQRALLNFYMSPAQFEIHEKHLDEIPNMRFVQSQIDWKFLKELKEKTKKIEGLIVSPTFMPGYHKGTSNIINWAEKNKKEVTMCGFCTSKEARQIFRGAHFIRYIGKLSSEDTLELIASAETLIFLPEWVEPTSRVIIEGILLGCDIITNENIGLYSWCSDPKPIDLEIQIMVSKVAFWDEIFYALKGSKKCLK